MEAKKEEMVPLDTSRAAFELWSIHNSGDSLPIEGAMWGGYWFYNDERTRAAYAMWRYLHRAYAPRVASVAPSQAPRLLTDDEVAECDERYYFKSARSIQRKFCEVNGLPQPDPHGSGVAPSQAPSFDVESMLRACVPGGSICDPQQVADAIRAYFADGVAPSQAPRWEELDEPVPAGVQSGPLEDCHGAIAGRVQAVSWEEAERLTDVPAVAEAIGNLLEDQTGTNATCLVRAVLEASRGVSVGQPAHSKSEYKRRVAQGDPNVAPPLGVEGKTR